MSGVESKMGRLAREAREEANEAWWGRWWADLCPTPEDEAVRKWALSFYGLSGVEQDIKRLRVVKRAIEEHGHYDEERDGRE